jgi:hypothetical protein
MKSRHGSLQRGTSYTNIVSAFSDKSDYKATDSSEPISVHEKETILDQRKLQ